MTTNQRNPELFEKQAELFKALSHPVRLCIVKNLAEQGESTVTNMQHCFDLPQSTVSQHITVLKAAGVIKGRRQGLEIFYSVKDEKAKFIAKLLFESEGFKED